MVSPEKTLKPPYYAVIFSSTRSDGEALAYAVMAERMTELAALQPGFLGVDTARDEDGFGITVSYWKSLADISAWKENAEHQEAQRHGRDGWYKSFHLHIALVERSYGS